MSRVFKLSLFIIFWLFFFNKVEANHNPLSSINYFAQEGSLGIKTPASSGSGFIIGRKNNEYFFITAGHVAFSDPKKEEYWVYSIANEKATKYRVTSFIKPKDFDGKDIVIGSFQTEDDLKILPILQLGSFFLYEESFPEEKFYTFKVWNVANGINFNYKLNIGGDPIIAGVSTPSNAITVPLFRTSVAYMQGNAVGNQNGYETIYSTTSTVPGMSGGGVFGARMCPTKKIYYDNEEKIIVQNSKGIKLEYSQNITPVVGGLLIGGSEKYYAGVLAMHGMSEEYRDSGSRSGTGLAIPLSLFSDFFKKNSLKYGVPIGKDYLDLVYSYCM